MRNDKLRLLLKEEIRRQLNVAEAIEVATGQDQTITNKVILKNLDFALKAVDSSIRPKIKTLIEDPEAKKALTTSQQRIAILSVISLAFGINEKEFSQAVSKIKDVLKDAEVDTETPQGTEQGTAEKTI
jgi:hypothetical protein